jgi:hypothetical protein
VVLSFFRACLPKASEGMVFVARKRGVMQEEKTLKFASQENKIG